MAPEDANRNRARRVSLAIGLPAGAALCLVVVVASFGIGPIPIAPADVITTIASRAGLGSEAPSQLINSVVWDLRMPRVLFAAITGAALASAGAALQSLFNNPLADPGIIGVSGGASTGAVVAIVALPPMAASVINWIIPLAAFVGGLGATALIYLLARPGRATGTSRLLLVGIAVGSACAAVTGFCTYLADDAELQTVVFWQMGSLASITWPQLAAALTPVLLGGTALLAGRRRLDLLTLGERQAQHLGLNVSLARGVIIVATALLTAATVSFAGGIGFVGLVVPHIVRMAFGPRHHAVLPMSMLAGAILIVVADTAPRTLAPPSEIPLGLFTATLGAPFFLMLVLRTRSVEVG